MAHYCRLEFTDRVSSSISNVTPNMAFFVERGRPLNHMVIGLDTLTFANKISRSFDRRGEYLERKQSVIRLRT